MKTIPVSELREILTGNAEAGLEGYRHYTELKGKAGNLAHSIPMLVMGNDRSYPNL